MSARPLPLAPRLRLPLLVLPALLLGACVDQRTHVRPEPGVVRGTPAGRDARPPGAGDRIHVVERGDTLFSIAFRNQIELQDLVAWNQIENPNLIKIGQRLRLNPPGRPGSDPGASGPIAATTPAGAWRDPDTGVVTAGVPDMPAGDALVLSEPPRSANPPAPTTAGIGSTTVIATPAPATSPPAASPPPAAPSAARDTRAPTNQSRTGFSWPVRGQVLAGFVAGDATRSGMDIRGTEGDPVYAAADGTVVYSGAGIQGFGELIVIRHSNGLLTAYGHNRKRLVNEQDQVRRGQRIAELGRDTRGRELLRFEIRQSGKPIDPAGHLPASP
ncbi:MAG: peptidoglycan DD-metalloendopeptidase family protein [Xanthomonadales bacterium]|jgi:lipoprotein NlpD|nr:peptidoglycan DD-metalloendopeptidase family protein [Xanthomonadales bacterium]